MDDLVPHDIVGEREQAADEYLVGRLPFGSPGVAVAARIGQLLGIEAALGAGGHDNGVLHPLRLHQAEDLGAEIVAPVRPAYPAACDRPGAQVDAFHSARIDEDLPPRHGPGQAGDRRGIEFERQRFAGGGGEQVGPQDRVHHRQVEPQQAIVVDRLDSGQPFPDRVVRTGFGFLAIAFEARIVARVEQGDEAPCDVRRTVQRINHGVDGVADAGLAQIAVEGAQQIRVARRKGGAGDQAVEDVVFGKAVQHRGNGLLDRAGAFQQLCGAVSLRQGQREIVNRPQIAVLEAGGHFGQHAKAEILERRNGIGKRQGAVHLIDLEAQFAVPRGMEAVEPGIASERRGPIPRLQPPQPQYVHCRLGGAVIRMIGQRERLGKARGERGRARRVFERGKLALHRFRPAAQHGLQMCVQRFLVRVAEAVADVDHEAQDRQVAAFDLQAPVQHMAFRGFFQHGLDAQAHAGSDHVAREPYEGEEVALQRRLDQRQARPRPVHQRHHRGDDPLDRAIGEAHQQVVGQRGQRMSQRLAVMADRIEPAPLHQAGQLLAQPRHRSGRGIERGARPDAGMDRQRGHAPILDQRDYEEVQRDVAVHVGKAVRLDHQRGAALAVLSPLVEPREGAFERGVGQQVARALAADAQQARLAAVAPAGEVAELSQHPAVQPAEQGRAFRIGHPVGILGQRLAHARPVVHRRAHVGQRGGQRGRKVPALLRVDPRGFDVDHRFALLARGIALRQHGKRPRAVSPHGENGMDQPVDGEALRGDRRRH